MISPHTNREVARRVKADLIIGADNYHANLERTANWARFSQPSMHGAINWINYNVFLKNYWHPHFIDNTDSYTLPDNYEDIATLILDILLAKSGRCAEHMLVALMYWLLYTHNDQGPITYSLVKFMAPYDHGFLIVNDGILDINYICDPWLDMVTYTTNEADFRNVISVMGTKLYENLVIQYQSPATDVGMKGALLHSINNLRLARTQTLYPALDVLATYQQCPDAFLLLLAIVKKVSTRMLINHPVFLQFTQLK